MNKITLRLVCGDYSVVVESPIDISNTTLGCSQVGNNDLYDLGFKHSKLQQLGLQVYYGDVLLMTFPAENL